MNIVSIKGISFLRHCPVCWVLKTMARNKVLTVRPLVINDSSSTFQFNLRRLLQYFSIIGVSVPINNLRGFHRFVSFISVFSIQICLNIHIFLNVESVSSSYSPNVSSSTMNWNYLIDALNFSVHVIGTHYCAILLITRTRKWKTLMDSFQKSISVECYHKCRIFSRNAILFVLLSVMTFLVILSNSYNNLKLNGKFNSFLNQQDFVIDVLLVMVVMTNTATAVRKLLDILSSLTKLYPSAVLALFCTLTLTACEQFKLIRFKLEQFIPGNERNKTGGHTRRTTAEELKFYMVQHSRVCRAVECLSNYFGLFLLLEVFFIFVGVINHSMFLLAGFINRDWEEVTFTVAFTLDQILRLIVITIISDNLSKQVLTDLMTCI